jgi:hypothetical protein
VEFRVVFLVASERLSHAIAINGSDYPPAKTPPLSDMMQLDDPLAVIES